jgi:hypothetical protein
MDVVRDVTLIFSFLAVLVAISQLRFSRLQIVRSLGWGFLILMIIILVMQIMKSEIYYRAKSFLDTTFWVSLGGTFVVYIFRKKASNATKAH